MSEQKKQRQTLIIRNIIDNLEAEHRNEMVYQNHKSSLDRNYQKADYIQLKIQGERAKLDFLVKEV